MKQRLVFLSVALLLSACASQQSVTPSPAAEQTVPPVVQTPASPVAVAPAPSPIPTAEPAVTKPKPVVQKVKPAPRKVVAKPVTVKKTIKQPTMIMGWLEHIQIADMETPAQAKLDSGADTSSIDADVIRTFKKDKKEYVVFRFRTDDGRSKIYERQIVRWVRIKAKKGKAVKRPVVMMDFCLGNQKIREEVNLADREHFKKAVLVGRNMLRHNVVLDPSRKYTIEPQCN